MTSTSTSADSLAHREFPHVVQLLRDAFEVLESAAESAEQGAVDRFWHNEFLNASARTNRSLFDRAQAILARIDEADRPNQGA